MSHDKGLLLGSPLLLRLHHMPPLTALKGFLVFFIGATIVYFLANEVVRARARVSGISGPRGLPVFGNLHQLKIAWDPAEKLREWGKEYGSVYQIMIGNEPVVVFNSMDAAKDVFIGQGGALVDRPQFYTFHKVLSTTTASFGTLPWYGHSSRAHFHDSI